MKINRGRFSLLVFCSITCAGSWAHGFTDSYHTDIRPPLFPTSMEQCDEYRQEIDADIKKTSDDHAECLKDAPREESGGPSGTDTCAKPACQKLHTLRSELNKERNDNYGECRRTVAAVERHRIEGVRDEDRNQDEGQSNEVQKGIDRATQAIAGRSVVGLTAHALKQIENSCKTGMSAQASKVCLEKIHAYSDGMLNKSAGNPIINKIQKESFDRIKQHQEKMIDAVENVEAEIDGISLPKDHGTSKKRGETWNDVDY